MEFFYVNYFVDKMFFMLFAGCIYLILLYFFCLFSKFLKLPFAPAFSIHMSHFMNFKFYIIQCFFYRNSLLPLTPEEGAIMSNDLNTVNSLLRSVEHIDRKVLFRSVEHIDRKVWADFAVHD